MNIVLRPITVQLPACFNPRLRGHCACLGVVESGARISELAKQVPVGRICTPQDIAKAALYFASTYFNDFQT
jgi:hypothetical protein